MVDHKSLNGSLRGFEFQAQLLAQRVDECQHLWIRLNIRAGVPGSFDSRTNSSR